MSFACVVIYWKAEQTLQKQTRVAREQKVFSKRLDCQTSYVNREVGQLNERVLQIEGEVAELRNEVKEEVDEIKKKVN